MALSQRLQSLEKQHQILEQAIQNLRKNALLDNTDLELTISESPKADH